MNLPKQVRICEVGLRDGLQNESVILTVEQKLELIEQLINAGVVCIEVGSFMNPQKVPQMAGTDEVFYRLKQQQSIEYRGMVPNMRGMSRAIECGCKKVRITVSASRAHNLANFNCTPEQTVSGFSDMVGIASDAGLSLAGGIMMAFGSCWESAIPLDDIRQLVETYISLGIFEITLSDSAGLAAPDVIYDTCNRLKASYPEVKDWIVHLHNTRGMGMSNLLAGMLAGITSFDTSFAGLGGCPFIPGATGNISTEDVVHMLSLMGIETGIDLDAILSIGRHVAELAGHPSESYVLRAGKSSDLLQV